MAKRGKAWDRRESESHAEYEAFMAYCKASPKERSFRAFGRLTGVSHVSISKWAGKHDWKERVIAWDSALHDKAFKMLSARAAKRDIKRYEDRLKEEEWASKQLPKTRKILLSILDDPTSGPRALLGAIDRVREMAHIDDIKLSDLKEDQDGASLMIHALKRVIAKLSDEDAKALRGILSKLEVEDG